MSTFRTVSCQTHQKVLLSNSTRIHIASEIEGHFRGIQNHNLKPTAVNEPRGQINRLSESSSKALRGFSTTKFRTMADDASYNTFLTRANQDPSSGHSGEGHSTSQARSQFDPSSKSSSQGAIPASLRDLNATYISDTDSEFEPVFFSYASDDLPTVEQFTKVLGVKGENAANVEELSISEFDPRGQYAEVIEKVKAAGVEERGKRGAGAGEAAAKVFKVQLDGSGTRIEYYIVSVGERSLVGVVAKAVES